MGTLHAHHSFVSTAEGWRHPYVSYTVSYAADSRHSCKTLVLSKKAGLAGQVIEGPGAYHMGLVDILQVWDW